MANRFVFTKKIGLLATLLLLLGSVWAFGEAGGSAAAGNYSFTVTDGGAVVTAYLGEGFADVVVPPVLGESPVVAIGSGAFWGNGDIRSVQLPATVTTIGSNAFTDCKRLAELSAVGVTTLGDYALYGCDGLTDITLGDRLATVGRQAVGTASPALSLASGTLDDLVRAYARLSEQGSLRLGSVAGVQVTDELLALDSSVGRLLGSGDTIDVERLWAADAVEVLNNDGSRTQMSLVELMKQLHSTGLYDVLAPDKRAGLELRLDALLESLVADARRL